jgi:diacylglycerol kinase family enzyme
METIAMDTFRVNDKLSVNVSGIGFDGHVAGLFGKNGKRGLVTYGKLVLTEFQKFKEFGLTMTLDGKDYSKEAFIVAFANSSQFGNNAQVAPQASVCDQLIDVCVIKKVPISNAIGFAHKMFTGQIEKSSFVEILQAKKIRIHFPQAMPLHIDGEAVPPESDFNIEIFPASLHMIVPQGQSSRV